MKAITKKSKTASQSQQDVITSTADKLLFQCRMNIKTPKDKFQGQIQVLVGLFLNQKSLKGYIILLISKTIHIFEAVLKNYAFFVYIVVNKYNFSNQSCIKCH